MTEFNPSNQIEPKGDFSIFKPGISASNHICGQIELYFSKLVRASLNVYSQRAGESQYILLAQISDQHFIDNRPPLDSVAPDVRKYKAMYAVNGWELGQFSDEIVIICRNKQNFQVPTTEVPVQS
jgi:hypothetical protein